MRRTIPVTVLLLFGIAATVLATGRAPAGPFVTFTGRVIDDVTTSAVAGASVIVEGTYHGTITGSAGEYRLTVPRTDLTPGTVRLVVMMPGYQQEVAALGITADAVRADFRLRAAAANLGEVARTEMADAAMRGRAAVSMSVVAAPGFVGMTSTAANPVHFLPPNWNTESYGHIVDNAFLSATGNPLSTFSIDVDRASYSNVRRFLLDGQLPPKDAVRVEEMINYFTYSYPTRSGEHPFAVTTEMGVAPWRPGHLLLRIGLASPRVETANLPPSNLVFLLDVSGSMQSPDKLPLVKQALRLLVNELRPSDRVAIVVYAGAAGLILPSTPGSEKSRILKAIESLEAGGSTAGGEGLRLAYRIAGENHLRDGNNRVILATDGDFNVGVSSDAEMIRLVEDRREQGTFLTVLGFGTGNLKDSKMEQMADHGNGNYAYIDSLLEARKVLVTEMGGTLFTVAKDVKLQVEFNPALVRAYRLIGYENRVLAAEDFNDDRKDAGDMGAGHSVTAIYEVVPVGAETDVVVRGTDPLRYQQETTPRTTAAGGEVAFVRVRYKRPDSARSILLEQPVANRSSDSSADMKFVTAVAGFGMLLRESEHRGSITPERVLALAREVQGADEEGYRAEFIRLVETYRTLRGSEAEPR